MLTYRLFSNHVRLIGIFEEILRNVLRRIIKICLYFLKVSQTYKKIGDFMICHFTHDLLKIYMFSVWTTNSVIYHDNSQLYFLSFSRQNLSVESALNLRSNFSFTFIRRQCTKLYGTYVDLRPSFPVQLQTTNVKKPSSQNSVKFAKLTLSRQAYSINTNWR